MRYPKLEESDTQELLTCPFCGAEAKLFQYGTFSPKAYIACTDCRARSPLQGGVGCEARAVTAWNRRAGPGHAMENITMYVSFESLQARTQGVSEVKK